MDAAPALPTVVVCSGVDGHWYDDRRVLSWLAPGGGRRRAGIVCTASHILARAGLLNGYRCTIHWENLAGFAETYPEIEATGELFNDRPQPLYLRRRDRRDGHDAVPHRRHPWREAGRSRSANRSCTTRSGQGRCATRGDRAAPRRSTARNGAAVKPMQENIEEPVDLLALSVELGQSRRNVERLFRKFMNCSPGRYYLGLRLQRARRPVPDQDVGDGVAISCGFSSATHFSKCIATISAWRGATTRAATGPAHRIQAGQSRWQASNERDVGQPGHGDNHAAALSVGFILTNNFTLTALSSIPGRVAARRRRRRRQPAVSVAAGTIIGTRPPNRSWSSCGIRVPGGAVPGSAEFDDIVVVGGLLHRGPPTGRAGGRLPALGGIRGVGLVGVCTGSFVLSRIGLMRGRRCCVSWYHHPTISGVPRPRAGRRPALRR